MGLKVRNKPPAKYRRYPELVLIWRSVSKPLRMSTWMLYDPDTEEHIKKVRKYKKGKSNDKSVS